ncbi:hypothetical protein U91I_01789 [alpha proteobacterium U9-1i]|nr:hypothetical protein U91I_01789 [alpha proteobacterium U9-1i]
MVSVNGDGTKRVIAAAPRAVANNPSNKGHVKSNRAGFM